MHSISILHRHTTIPNDVNTGFASSIATGQVIPFHFWPIRQVSSFQYNSHFNNTDFRHRSITIFTEWVNNKWVIPSMNTEYRQSPINDTINMTSGSASSLAGQRLHNDRPVTLAHASEQHHFVNGTTESPVARGLAERHVEGQPPSKFPIQYCITPSSSLRDEMP